jgi:hypothetical protein
MKKILMRRLYHPEREDKNRLDSFAVRECKRNGLTRLVLPKNLMTLVGETG